MPLLEHSQSIFHAMRDNMSLRKWAQAWLALSSLVSAQSSTSAQLTADGLTTGAAMSTTASIGTVTPNGSSTTYSVAYTVPASADVGPNILPNVKDPNAKQAQSLCPGYHASNVQKTNHGLQATLNLAGDPVWSDHMLLVSAAD